jgi:hypothetical protein
MTTEQLERDLEALGRPREADEHLRLAIRAQLGQQLEARPGRRFRTRLAFGMSSLAAAAAAVAIVVLVGTGGGGPSPADAAIIRAALRALTPPANTIVHVKETAEQNGTPVGAEWWQQGSAPYAMRMIKGALGKQGEFADDGATFSRYDAAANTIVQGPALSPPTLVDPLQVVRAQLVNGNAQVAGSVTIDGVSLYKIELPNGVVGYFDRTSYRPVYVDNPQRDGSVVRARVVAYEELAPTPENEQLLSLTAQHPDARVTAATNPQDTPATEAPPAKKDAPAK